MSDFEEFSQQRQASIARLKGRSDLRAAWIDFLQKATAEGYLHNFDWLGLPVIQLPQDMMAVQELIWRIKPQAIVETGVARGGSLILSASMLELVGGDGVVIGVELDMRAHNRQAVEHHKLAKRIRIVEGSSIEPATLERVKSHITGTGPVIVFLDSNHTHDHVLAELKLYAPLVKAGSYMVVFDTVIDEFPADYFKNRPWGPGNNPRTAVHEFLRGTDRFEIDHDMEAKILLTCNPDGFLRCTKNP